jgi:hypothetical protein
MRKVHSSRRAASLKPGDYDHEIHLIDHDGASSPKLPASQGPERETGTAQDPQSSSEEGTRGESPQSEDAGLQVQELASVDSTTEQGQALRPSIEVQMPTPAVHNNKDRDTKPHKHHKQRETVIDILYENERGGFLCGTALFSSKALGGLDAPPWSRLPDTQRTLDSR